MTRKATTLLCPYLYRERFGLKIQRYRVPIVNLPDTFDGFTILHLTDLHDKEFGTGGKELLDLVRSETFQMVALTGDLVLGPRYRLTPALELIDALKDVPVLSVSGNHDWGEGGRDWQLGDSIKKRVEEAGARVLSNESFIVEQDGARLWVVGVDDPVTEKDRIERAVVDIPKDACRLLLCHSPHIFRRAVEHGMDLLLAGHTHGGQIRFPLIGAAYVPKLGLFPRWDHGYFRCGNSSMVVNGGLGESWLQVRWNIPPEVALITLQKAMNNEQ